MLQRILIILVFLSLLPTAAFADFAAGKRAYDMKDWATAIKELRPLAEGGDDRAMIILGNMYNAGFGVAASHTEAMNLYKRAAARNNPQAMDAIGAMYISAVGVDQNLKTALEWFLRSGNLGDQIGAFFYATIELQGNRTQEQHLDPDPYTAYKWFKIAAAEKQNAVFGRDAGRLVHGIATKALTPAQVAKADQEVAAWKPVDISDADKILGPLPKDPPQRFGPFLPENAGPLKTPASGPIILPVAPVMNSAPPPAATNTPSPPSGQPPK